MRTDSRWPSRSSARSSAFSGARGRNGAFRQDTAAYQAAAVAWAATVPHADPLSPACKPNTKSTSSATLSPLAPSAMRSGVRVFSRPVMCPLPA